jgi:RHS repeat-associated protein
VVKSLQGGTTTVSIFAGSTVIAEYDNGAAPGSPSREYIYNPAGGSTTGLLAMISGGATTYYHQDHLSVRLTTDANGNILSQEGHYPFGEAWYESGSGNNWFFTSYDRDSETGLDYALARYYNSRTGTFCSADPLAGSPGDPQSWNRYPYGRNDPIDKNDPSGKHWWNWALLAGGIAAAIFAPEIDAYLGSLFGGGDAAAAGGAAATDGAAAATDGAAAATDGVAAADVGGTAGTAGAASIETTAPSVSFSLDAGGMPSGIALSTTTTVNVTAGAGPSIWAATGNALPFMGTIQMNAWYHPPSKTPWYKNPCIRGALLSGAGNVGLDALGMIPGEKIAAFIFKDGAKAAKVAKGIKYGQAGLGGVGLGNAMADSDWAGVGLDIAGAIPGPVGMGASAISTGVDVAKTVKAVKKCN